MRNFLDRRQCQISFLKKLKKPKKKYFFTKSRDGIGRNTVVVGGVVLVYFYVLFDLIRFLCLILLTFLKHFLGRLLTPFGDWSEIWGSWSEVTEIKEFSERSCDKAWIWECFFFVELVDMVVMESIVG